MMDGDEQRMQLAARRLIEKYTRPEPPEILFESFDQDVLEVWGWAEAAGRIDTLAPLAWVVCRRLKGRSSDHDEMLRLLNGYAEQTRAAGHLRETAQLLMALAELEDDRQTCLDWYAEASKIYAGLGEWAGEANCAALAGEIYLRQRLLAQARQAYLRSYALWSQAKHINGVAVSLIDLARILELEGEYLGACRLLDRAREMLFNRSIWTIYARDTMNRILFDHNLPPELVKRDKSAEALVAEVFGL